MGKAGRFLELCELALQKLKREGFAPTVVSTVHYVANRYELWYQKRRKRERKREIIDEYSDDEKYLNVGGGDFVWDNWRVLDYDSEWYDYAEVFIDYKINLEKTNRWPIDSDSYDLVFSSHTLEHLSDTAVKHTLSEANRILKPGGKIRINVPDVDIAEYKYTNNDIEWFIQRRNSNPPSELSTENFVMEEYYIGFFATHLTKTKDRSNHRTVDFETVKEDYERLEIRDFYQKYTNKIRDEWQQEKPGWHRNWFNYDRLENLLEASGFDDVTQKQYEVSDCLDFTYSEFNRWPYFSISVEATA